MRKEFNICEAAKNGHLSKGGLLCNNTSAGKSNIAFFVPVNPNSFGSVTLGSDAAIRWMICGVIRTTVQLEKFMKKRFQHKYGVNFKMVECYDKIPSSI